MEQQLHHWLAAMVIIIIGTVILQQLGIIT